MKNTSKVTYRLTNHGDYWATYKMVGAVGHKLGPHATVYTASDIAAKCRRAVDVTAPC